jgi:hypothetical protein
MATLSGVLLGSGCRVNPNYKEGTIAYYCVRPAPPGSPLAARGGVLPVGGRYNPVVCSDTFDDAQAGCQALCAVAKLDGCFVVPDPFLGGNVWLSDLQRGVDTCSQNACRAEIKPIGPPIAGISDFVERPHDQCSATACGFAGRAACRKASPTGCEACDCVYACQISCNHRTACDSREPGVIRQAVGTRLTGTHMAALRAVPFGDIRSVEDPSRGGAPVGGSGFPSLQFSAAPGGIMLDDLLLPVREFVFTDAPRLSGSVRLRTRRVFAAAVGPGSYEVRGGTARLHLLAVGDDGLGYVTDVTNFGPMTLDVGDPLGPRLRARFEGELMGHPVTATVDAPFVWLNRPPNAVLRAADVTFDSELLPGATTNSCGSTGDEWRGVPDAKTVVMFDASASWDPDPVDHLIYAFNGQPAGSQPIGAVELGVGRYTVGVAVQDQFGATAFASVRFQVEDRARFICRRAVAATRIPTIPRFQPAELLSAPVAPAQLAAIVGIEPVASSASIEFSRRNRGLIKRLGRGAWKIYQTAVRPEFGVAGIRTQPQLSQPFCPAVLGTPGGVLPGVIALFGRHCGGCGDGACQQPTETCGSCPSDCGLCAVCGDERCAGDETCSTCAGDCGGCTVCANGTCDVRESVTSCPADCVCSNDTCDAGESVSTCGRDCYCGNGTCDAGEDATACGRDCYCGNGSCDVGESTAACTGDCRCGDGVCDPAEAQGTCYADCQCGNGTCDAGEDATACGRDCYCGNGSCDVGESTAACTGDCRCGDGVCDPAEAQGTCYADCHCGDDVCDVDVESSTTCAADCHCPNDVCDRDRGETIANCPRDCGPL